MTDNNKTNVQNIDPQECMRVLEEEFFANHTLYAECEALIREESEDN